MVKIVKSAKIEVIEPSELKIGDCILWANIKRRVININLMNRFIIVDGDPYPNDKVKESLPLYRCYYRIVSCEEIEIDLKMC